MLKRGARMIRKEASRNSMQVWYVTRPSKDGRKKIVNTAMRSSSNLSRRDIFKEDFSDEHTARQRYDRNLSSKIRK